MINIKDKASFLGNNLVALILVGLLGGGAFYIGHLYTRVQMLEEGGDKAAAPANGNAAGAAAQPTAAPATAEDVPPVAEEDHVRGKRDARIMLIEYSDYECPFCKRFHSTAQQAVDEYGDKLAWVYRHFPLSLHPNAQMQAEASECVAEQGGNDAFWQYTDIVFERTESTGTSLSEEDVADIAAEIGLDRGEFESCLASGKYTQDVKDEMDAGAAAGVSGTPGNILLDTETGKTQLIPGAVPYQQLKQGIDSLLEG